MTANFFIARGDGTLRRVDSVYREEHHGGYLGTERFWETFSSYGKRVSVTLPVNCRNH